MKRILNKSLTFIFLLITSAVYGQSNASFLPVNVGKGVNTSFNEINPVVSPDGKTLYFCRLNHPLNYYGKQDSQDVWYSELQSDGTWGEAKHMDNFINGARYNAVLSISNDGKKLLVTGGYTALKKWYRNGLSIVSKFGEEWSKPEFLNIPGYERFSEGQTSNAFLSNDGSFLLLGITKRYNGKKLNLYVSKNEDGRWGRLINLGKVINTPNNSEESPTLTNNNEVMYFSSNRKDGKGSFDIYKSNRLSASWKEWSAPILLSDTINSPVFESNFKLNRKGTFACFTSKNKGTDGSADIFKVKLIEEQPFVVLYGKVLNSVTKEPMINKKDFIITVNDKKPDSIKINYDSASYRLKLRFGKKYVIKPIVKNYITIVDSIDATNITEYFEIQKDLYVKPIPYALVKGRFIDKNTGLIIPKSARPKLVVNGMVSDSMNIDTTKSPMRVFIDSETSSFTARLPYGEGYALSVKAAKYKPVMDSLDLTKVTEYQEFSKTLYGEKVILARAIITGKVYDKKTGKLFDPAKTFSVVIDSLPGVVASINSAASEYTLEVDPGKAYTIGARAEKYYALFERIDLRKEKGAIKIIKDLTLAPIVIGQAIRMNNIFFISGKAQLTPASYPELDKLANFLKENPSIKVEIAGHTDNVGKPDKNLQLSRWRARACELYIESKGVPTTQITFNGYGQTKPVASNKTPMGKAQNRRVEFVIKEVSN